MHIKEKKTYKLWATADVKHILFHVNIDNNFSATEVVTPQFITVH